MKTIYIALFNTLIFFSCGDNTESKEEVHKEEGTPEVELVEESNLEPVTEAPIALEQKEDEIISTKAIILSVNEELIMPSDHLTMAITVKTATNDTLVFLDMYGFENMINQEIDITYQLTPFDKLLVCFDCESYTEPIQIYDISSIPTEVEFTKLKLSEYIPDPYIIPAAIFVMEDEQGNSAEFHSNDNNLISDSLKMKEAFYNYGVLTKMYPELKNREELEQLVN